MDVDPPTEHFCKMDDCCATDIQEKNYELELEVESPHLTDYNEFMTSDEHSIFTDSTAVYCLGDNNFDPVDSRGSGLSWWTVSEDKDDLDISPGQNQSQFQSPTNSCKCCEDMTDISYWTLKEPTVSMEAGVPVYQHSSPAGSFEYVVSGFRWVSDGEITFKYHLSDPEMFRAKLAMLQYMPIGPLMDIKVLAGELLEAHLPHFACLDSSDSLFSDAVRVLHGVDSSVTLETCELTRFHAKLLRPSFSLTEVLVRMGVPVKAHLDVLIYRTTVKPLTLYTYVVPRDASMIQAVEEEFRENRNAKKIKKPRPTSSIWMNTKFSLQSSCSADIQPSEITLKYIRPPDFFEVFMGNAEDYFHLELMSAGKSIWRVTLRKSVEYGNSGEVVLSHNMSLPRSGHSEEVTHRKCSWGVQPSTMTSKSNQDRLFKIRPDLIKRTTRPLLRDLLDRLQAHCPPVISGREAEDILQRTNVLQDQVTSLMDIVLKKGDSACGILFSLLKEVDIFFYESLGLDMTAGLGGDGEHVAPVTTQHSDPWTQNQKTKKCRCC